MAVTVVDTRTIIDEADSTTGWSSPVAGESLALIATIPTPVESDQSIGMVVSTQQSDLVHTITAIDYSDTLVYVWVQTGANLETTAAGGIALVMGDAAELTGYHLAGSDVAAFRHNSGPVTWQCLVIDTSQMPTANFTDLQGAEVDLDFTNITRIGSMFTTLSKALGNLENCFTDIIRVGLDGLIVRAGTSGDPGIFSEIEAADNVVTSQGAYGIIHELGTDLFGLQGPLTFGDVEGGTPGNTASYFADTNVTVTFEDRGFGTDKYFIDVVGNSTLETTFQLGTKVGSTGGSDGCTIFAAAGVGATWDSSQTDLEFCLLYGSKFSGFEGGMIFSSDATNAPNHEIMACTFSGNGQIDIGLTEFKNNAIAAAVVGAEFASVLISDTTNISDLSFTSDGTGHGILITTPGNYTFTNFSYTNFGADDTTDASLYNNSGGAVTISVTGVESPTVRNGAGASTSVINTKTLDFHVENTDGDDVEFAQVYIQKTTPTAQFAGDEYNQVGQGFVITSATIDSDIPLTGWIIVFDRSENATLPYRYDDHDGVNRITFPTSVTGQADSAGTRTQLFDTAAFGSVKEGDTIRNTTDNSWAVVDQKISANEILTSPLRNGTDNTWASGDDWSVHDLATTLENNIDTIDIPLANEQTNATGDIPTVSFSFGSSIPITVRIRSNEGATKYVPFVTAATITGDFAGSAVITEDTVAI